MRTIPGEKMLEPLVEIFGYIGLILGALGFVFLETAYDPAFSPGKSGKYRRTATMNIKALTQTF